MEEQQVSTTLKRVNYTSGQLLTVESLQTEQEYFRSRQRRHNRWLHGAGVVHGLQVAADGRGGQVTVQPGSALDCAGNELVVESPCSFKPGDGPRVLYLALQHQERLAEPIPLPGSGGEADMLVETVIEEFTLAGLYADNPQPHGSPGQAPGAGCGSAHPVVIAVLERSAGGWQLRPAEAAGARDG